MIQGNKSLFLHLMLLSLSSICMGSDLRKDTIQIEISLTTLGYAGYAGYTHHSVFLLIYATLGKENLAFLKTTLLEHQGR